jgi:hypothetical protein
MLTSSQVNIVLLEELSWQRICVRDIILYIRGKEISVRRKEACALKKYRELYQRREEGLHVKPKGVATLIKLSSFVKPSGALSSDWLVTYKF